MRNEPGKIAGDRRFVLAHQHAGRLAGHHPRTENHMAVAKIRDRNALLANEAFLAIGAIIAGQRPPPARTGGYSPPSRENSGFST